MKEAKVAPYGTWKSPITSGLIASKNIELLNVSVVGNKIFWLEMRPEENGRYVIMYCASDNGNHDINLPPYNARTLVHEYGGASYIADDNAVLFSNFDDQRVYQVDCKQRYRAITRGGTYRYADGLIDRKRRQYICVREDHGDTTHEATNTIVSVSLAGNDNQEETVLVQGADFYSSPRLRQDGRQLAWISWCHPNMPWDGSELWIAELDERGFPIEAQLIAGSNEESILQPEWSPTGDLYFISDRSGWWNLYRQSRDETVECVVEMSADFGNPPWSLGDSNYAFESDERIVCTYTKNGIDYLASIDLESKRFEKIKTPYTSISHVRAVSERVIFLGSSPSKYTSVVEVDLKTAKTRILRCSNDMKIDPEDLSKPEAIEFPTGNGLTAHAFFYPPKNREYIGPDCERPPLLVLIHGGPTASSDSSLKLPIQYWSSRGIAVLDVNYGGSSGYGRSYRQRLNGQWGIVDVDDSINGARYLVEKGLVDESRIAIRGSSAGGFTTLSALTFRNYFSAGASQYGVSDLEALANHTHKFESHYLTKLIGPYPQMADLYKQRSPINALELFSCPVIFFQGLEDKIVPPEQTEKMVAALQAKKQPVAYIAFRGEQHGLRSSASIKRVLDAELYFYSRIFGFNSADPITPVQIDNL